MHRSKKYDKEKAIITLHGNKIEQISHTKFLGVYIDEHLTWDEHIKQISSKVSKSIGILWKLKPFLTSKLLLVVYNTLVLPYLSYCNLIWSSACDTRIGKLFVLQKRAVRIIDKAEYLAHTEPIFKKLNLLTVQDLGKQQVATFVYRFLKNDLPTIFSKYFVPTTDVHSHST